VEAAKEEAMDDQVEAQETQWMTAKGMKAGEAKRARHGAR